MIEVHPERCSGCARCEVSCSFSHGRQTGRARSRIKVVRLEDRGVDAPVTCRQCRERYCLSCPEGALRVGERGEIEVLAERCTACGACVQACPVGALELVDGRPWVCDLCGGDPACVRACNLGALELSAESERVSLKRFKRGSRDLDPEAKRVRYVEAEAAGLRERWLEGAGAEDGTCGSKAPRRKSR